MVNTFGIGDVLFSTPLVRALKERLPGTQIDFMCNKRGQHVVHGNPSVSDIIVFEKDEFRDAFKRSKMKFFRMLMLFLKKIKKRRYDLVVDLSLGYQLSLILKLLGVKDRIGFNYRDRGRFLTKKLDIKGFTDKHVVEYYLDVLRLIGINDATNKVLELHPAPEANAYAADFMREHGLEHRILIAIAPGGGKSWGAAAPYRRWDSGNFSYVAEELVRKNRNLFFLVLGSTDEKGLCAVIENSLAKDCINLCGKIPLAQVVALIKRCALILCNDGGLLHIAASQGIKTVSIFGPVDDRIYGPYPPSEKNRVVVAEGVGCRPCYSNFKHNICGNYNCLKGISRQKVLNITEDVLGLESAVYS